MSPALFLGWRIDSGRRYRNVVKSLDYQDFRIRGLSQAIDVPEPELYVEDGSPVFPVAHARDQALLEGMPTRSEDEVPSLPEIDLKEVPSHQREMALPLLQLQQLVNQEGCTSLLKG